MHAPKRKFNYAKMWAKKILFIFWSVSISHLELSGSSSLSSSVTSSDAGADQVSAGANWEKQPTTRIWECRNCHLSFSTATVFLPIFRDASNPDPEIKKKWAPWKLLENRMTKYGLLSRLFIKQINEMWCLWTQEKSEALKRPKSLNSVMTWSLKFQKPVVL